jgi:hypothetical protein
MTKINRPSHEPYLVGVCITSTTVGPLRRLGAARINATASGLCANARYINIHKYSGHHSVIIGSGERWARKLLASVTFSPLFFALWSLRLATMTGTLLFSTT